MNKRRPEYLSPTPSGQRVHTVPTIKGIKAFDWSLKGFFPSFKNSHLMTLDPGTPAYYELIDRITYVLENTDLAFAKGAMVYLSRTEFTYEGKRIHPRAWEYALTKIQVAKKRLTKQLFEAKAADPTSCQVINLAKELDDYNELEFFHGEMNQTFADITEQKLIQKSMVVQRCGETGKSLGSDYNPTVASLILQSRYGYHTKTEKTGVMELEVKPYIKPVPKTTRQSQDA